MEAADSHPGLDRYPFRCGHTYTQVGRCADLGVDTYTVSCGQVHVHTQLWIGTHSDVDTHTLRCVAPGPETQEWELHSWGILQDVLPMLVFAVSCLLNVQIIGMP